MKDENPTQNTGNCGKSDIIDRLVKAREEKTVAEAEMQVASGERIEAEEAFFSNPQEDTEKTLREAVRKLRPLKQRLMEKINAYTALFQEFIDSDCDAKEDE